MEFSGQTATVPLSEMVSSVSQLSFLKYSARTNILSEAWLYS